MRLQYVREKAQLYILGRSSLYSRPPDVTWMSFVRLFHFACCSILSTVKDTTHHGHAFDIAKALDLNYDAIVTVSGDGLIHEVMNGFANHEDPRTAFDTPIGPIPTGSGNALALNLLGFEVLETTSFTGLKAQSIWISARL